MRKGKISLKWEDLIENPDQVAVQIKSLPQVTVATPRLIASSILTVGDELKGVQILGIDPIQQRTSLSEKGCSPANLSNPMTAKASGSAISSPISSTKGQRQG